MKIRLSKRMLTALLIISLVVPVMAPMIYSQAADANIEKGDMNEDGEIDVKDLILVKQATEGDAADLNKDTSITDLDAKLMRYRLVDIISDFKGYYGLNGNTGSSQTMTTGVETATIEEKTVAASYAMGDITDKYGNSAVLLGSQAISWSEDHAVSFKVYNPTEYTHNIDIRAYKTVNAVTNTTAAENTEILQGVHVKAKSSVTVTIYGSEFEYENYPYLGIYTTTNYECGDDILGALKLYFYDFTEKTATEPICDDYQWTKTSSVDQAFTAINTDKNYIADGDYSLFFKPHANYPTFVVGESNVEWSEVGKFSFEVYNPTAYEQHIRLRAGNLTDSTWQFDKAYKLASEAWTTIEIDDLSNWVDGCDLRFTTTASDAISADAYTAYQKQGIYLDSFDLMPKPDYILNGKNNSTDVMLTGVERIQVEDETVVAAYAATNVNYSNPPGAIFVGTDAIDWTEGKSVSFKVYNPTTYDYNFDLRAYNRDYPTNGGTIGDISVLLQGVTIKAGEVKTVTVYSSMCNDWATYKYLGIYAPHTQNGNIKAGETGGERMANMKLYFYGFSEATETEPTSEDYKWTQGQDGMSESFTAINTNEHYIKDGEYSLFFVPTGNYASVVLNKSTVQWSEAGSLTISIYNPTEYEQKIRFYRTKTDKLSQGAAEATQVGETHNILKAKDWTTITFTDFTGWTVEDHLTVRVNQAWNNGEGQWSAFQNQGIYIDISVTMK